MDLRSILMQGMVSEKVAGRLAQAKEPDVLAFAPPLLFNCGQPTWMASAGWKRVCDACKPSISRAPIRSSSLAGLRRQMPARPPAAFSEGTYSALAGFVEAARRWRTPCAQIRKKPAFPRAAFPTWPRSLAVPCSLMIGALAEAEDRRSPST